MNDDAVRKAQGDRLAQARELAGYRSARAAAIENEWPESTYRAHENGSRTIGQDDAERYARRYRAAGVHVTGQMILYGGEAPKKTAETAQVPVMGRIGAGAEIMPEFEQLPPEGLYEIDALIPLPEGAIAFEVEGNSMWPRYDEGDVVICWQAGSDIEGLLGHEAAVRTSEGKRYLKRVLRGATKGTFDLESHNAEPIRGVKLEWVSAVGM